MLSNVDTLKIQKMICNEEELLRIANTKAGMFQDSEEVLEDYKRHKDYGKFELDLYKAKKLRQDKGLIIVDNQVILIDPNVKKHRNISDDETVGVAFSNTIERNNYLLVHLFTSVIFP